jgi:exonuclease V gamma subunit
MGNILPVWIEYLVYLSSGREGELRIAGLDPVNDRKGVQGVWAMKKDRALGYLKDLIDLYRLGLERPLPFMPKLSEAFLEHAQEGEEKAKEWLITEKLELEEGSREDPESLEPHFRMHAFPDVADFPLDEFARLARRVLEPIDLAYQGSDPS